MKPYYDQDGITIYCGDNRKIVPQLDGPFDLLLTDPPYGIAFAAQPTTGQRARGNKAQDWDSDTAHQWMLDQCIDRTESAIIWGGNYYQLPAARCWLAWSKPDAPPSMGNVEFAWTNLDQNSRHLSHSIAATNAERVGHPTQKPHSVISWCLSQVPDAQTVLDPWMGSGTTLVAAKLRGLKAVGIEINESYCEIAVRRLAQGVLITA